MMEKKKTMGSNPLEEYLSAAKEKPVRRAQEENRAGSLIKKKERITIHLPVDLIDRVKNAVYWEPGLTLTGFAEYALEQALKQQIETRGEVYPERKEKALRSGRPVL
jgi:predicted DNA binding CopG/RHH family protein